jgi:hypothetical protein
MRLVRILGGTSTIGTSVFELLSQFVQENGGLGPQVKQGVFSFTVFRLHYSCIVLSFGAMSVCMYVYIHVYVCVCVCTHARTHARMYVCMYVCMYVFMYVRGPNCAYSEPEDSSSHLFLWSPSQDYLPISLSSIPFYVISVLLYMCSYIQGVIKVLCIQNVTKVLVMFKVLIRYDT